MMLFFFFFYIYLIHLLIFMFVDSQSVLILFSSFRKTLKNKTIMATKEEVSGGVGLEEEEVVRVDSEVEVVLTREEVEEEEALKVASEKAGGEITKITVKVEALGRVGVAMVTEDEEEEEVEEVTEEDEEETGVEEVGEETGVGEVLEETGVEEDGEVAEEGGEEVETVVVEILTKETHSAVKINKIKR